jgi:hypothetical protein
MHKRFAEEQLAIACDNDNQYVCGSQLFPAGHKLKEAVYCNHSLTCSSLVNANAPTRSKLADSFAVSLCSSCGIEQLAPDRSEQLGCNQTVQTLLGSVGLFAAYAAAIGWCPSKEVQGHTSCYKAQGGWHEAQTQGQ